MNAAKKRKITAVAAFALIVFSYVLTTIAWLTMQTGEVTNTFTVGDVKIKLTEHKSDSDTHNVKSDELVANDGDYKENTHYYVPGLTMTKDPTVTVEPGSAACWLFIKIVPYSNYFSTDTNKTDPIIKWAIDDTVWKQVPDTKYYWYRKVDAVPSTDQAAVFNVLKDKSVRINDIFSEEQFESIKHQPRLFIRAGAIQSDNIPTGLTEEESAGIALSMMSFRFRNTTELLISADATEIFDPQIVYPAYKPNN